MPDIKSVRWMGGRPWVRLTLPGTYHGTWIRVDQIQSIDTPEIHPEDPEPPSLPTQIITLNGRVYWSDGGCDELMALLMEAKV